ncbi:MAG: hypothetical protein ACR5KV_06315 [Wolbachia sp.]
MHKQWALPAEAAQPEVRHYRFGQREVLCIWWNFEGVLRIELIPDDRAIDS